MKTNKMQDYYPPLFIDIGSDTVKYSQTTLNTFKLTKDIINKKEVGQPLDNDIVNANTIFDYKSNMTCKPIIDYLFNIYKGGNPIPLLEYEAYKNEQNLFDFSGLEDTQNMLYGYEPIYGGRIISHHFDIWEKIVEEIGRDKYSKNYFENEKFAETPLIISQEALPPEELEDQVKNIYEMCFERLNAQYVLIFSQAMINLFSHNLTSGIVVDVGESKTSIIPVINGFTCYDKAYKNDFFCGRTITALLAQINKTNEEECLNFNPSITLDEYMAAKLKKESDEFCCYSRVNPGNIKFSHLSWLFTFPEIFRSLYRSTNQTTHESLRNFIKGDSVLHFNSREALTVKNQMAGMLGQKGSFEKVLSVKEWEMSLIKFYSSHNILDQYDFQLMKTESNYISKDQLSAFRQNSLTNIVCSQLETYINEDGENSPKYTNIVFAGGVFNTKNLSRTIEKDLKSLMINAEKTVQLYFPNPEHNASCSFVKGVNYMSKLDNLNSLMVSRQDYYDVGKEYLSYNYF